MAMVRAAFRGGHIHTRPLSSPLCLKSQRHSSSAMEIFVPQEAPKHYTDSGEHATNCHGNSSGQNLCSGFVRNTVSNFLKEQRSFLIELQRGLKDQRLLLNSIRKELGLQNIESKMREEWIDDIGSLSEDVSSFLSEWKTRKKVSGMAVSIPFRNAATAMSEHLEGNIEQDLTLIPEGTSGNDVSTLCRDTVSAPSFTNAEAIISEQCEKNLEQESTLVPEGTSGIDVPRVTAEEKRVNGDLSASKETDTKKFQHPSWPEWTVFLNHLRPYASATEKQNVDSELWDDTTCLKRALVKFAQAHEGAFRSLSQKDLLALVLHDLPSMDDKTAIGRKKLQNYLQIDKTTEKRTWRNQVSQAKLTDVVRLVYRAVRSMPALNGDLPVELKEAVLHILQDLNSAGTAQDKGSIAKLENAPAVINQATQGMNQEVELAKVDEGEIFGNFSTVQGEASSHPGNSSIHERGSTLGTPTMLSTVDFPKFSSLKERVDARRERLARENREKEAATSLLPPPLLMNDVNIRPTKKSSLTVQKSKDHVVAMDFEAFDAIIQWDDDNTHVSSKIPGKSVSGREKSGAHPIKTGVVDQHRLQHKGTKGKTYSEKVISSKSTQVNDEVGFDGSEGDFVEHDLGYSEDELQ